MTSIVFLEPTLSLINAPLKVFPHFLWSILSLIQSPPEFFNISLTPTSLSIICPQDLARDLFSPIIAELQPDSGASIEELEYVCMQINGQGLGDGSRLLELTQPLARAGVSILFITTYFSDYVMVAAKAMHKVRKVLLDRGFSVEGQIQSFEGTGEITPAAIISQSVGSSTRSISPEQFDFDEEVDRHLESYMQRSTESIADHVAQETGVNTLQFLREGKIPVKVLRDTKLRMLGSKISLDAIPMIKLFTRRDLPPFFSITQAPQTSPSLLLTADLIDEFDKSTLLGLDTAEILIPIVLDLSGLETAGVLGGCGIICGVVDELMQRAVQAPESLEQVLEKEELVMSYLSTVVTGNVLIREQDVERYGPAEECKVM